MKSVTKTTKKKAKVAIRPKTAKKHPPARVAARVAAAKKSSKAKPVPKVKLMKVVAASKAKAPVRKPEATPLAPKLAKIAGALAKKGPAPLAKINGKGLVSGKKPGEGEAPGDPDSPLLDMSDVGVRKMIARAKQRGYVTYDELNKVLPSDKVSSEQIEDTMSMLSEMGINVIESEEQDE